MCVHVLRASPSCLLLIRLICSPHSQIFTDTDNQTANFHFPQVGRICSLSSCSCIILVFLSELSQDIQERLQQSVGCPDKNELECNTLGKSIECKVAVYNCTHNSFDVERQQAESNCFLYKLCDTRIQKHVKSKK